MRFLTWVLGSRVDLSEDKQKLIMFKSSLSHGNSIRDEHIIRCKIQLTMEEMMIYMNQDKEILDSTRSLNNNDNKPNNDRSGCFWMRMIKKQLKM